MTFLFLFACSYALEIGRKYFCGSGTKCGDIENKTYEEMKIRNYALIKLYLFKINKLGENFHPKVYCFFIINC